MKIHEGKLEAKGFRFGIVAARFNSLVTDRLLSGALEALRRYGADDGDIEVARVPGSFEIPLFARLMAASGRFHAVICLGAIIKGETPHYDYIASAVVGALGDIMQRHDVPVVLGVLTTDNVDQAVARAGVEQDNKGHEAAVTAIEMASLHRILHGRQSQ